jgi:hypothetical protein
LHTVLSPSVGVQGFPLGSQWTLSYYSDKSPSSVGQIVEYRDGTAVQNANTVAITGVPMPTATGKTLGSYTQYSTTFTINASPAATSRCLVVHISSTDTASATFAYAQLEPGPTASNFELRPIATELALCQRYYQSHFQPPATGSSQNSSTFARIRFGLPVTMRSEPTVTLSGTLNWSCGSHGGNIVSLGTVWTTVNKVEFDCTSSIGTVPSADLPIAIASLGESGYINADAEL